MDSFVVKNGKELKSGYTTGSCATAAAVCALHAILTKKPVQKASITLPSNEIACLPISEINFSENSANCIVIKDAGDDPDVTHGAKICADVTLTSNSEIIIDGGAGVGRVTCEGLKQKIGEAAINPIPMKMIRENITALMKKHGYSGGVKIIISVEQGEEIAKNTFNERLGIIGGISILGTTGIVEPMSEKAIIDTIKLTIDKIACTQNDYILLVFGNYGEEFCKNKLNLDIKNSVQISNFVGEALDYVKYKNFKNILLVGHTGKIIKLAGGIMDTHSKTADCRMEILSAHSALNGADKKTVSDIMTALTTDKAFEIICGEDYYSNALSSLSQKISFYVNYRLKNEVNFAFFAFGTEDKFNFFSENYKDMIKLFR